MMSTQLLLPYGRFNVNFNPRFADLRVSRFYARPTRPLGSIEFNSAIPGSRLRFPSSMYPVGAKQVSGKPHSRVPRVEEGAEMGFAS